MVTASGAETAAGHMLRFSRDVFAETLLRPLGQDTEEGTEGGGECVEENDSNT